MAGTHLLLRAEHQFRHIETVPFAKFGQSKGPVQAHLGVIRQERRDLIFVLRPEEGAGRIDQPSLRSKTGPCTLEHAPLQFAKAAQRIWGEAPFLLRIPAPGARARAGGIDEDQIAASAERIQTARLGDLDHLPA